jgi:hypothetical protein
MDIDCTMGRQKCTSILLDELVVLYTCTLLLQMDAKNWLNKRKKEGRSEHLIF